MSLMSAGLVCAEIARVDCSLSTFILVHSALAMITIEMLVEPSLLLSCFSVAIILSGFS